MFKTITLDNNSEYLDFQSLGTSSECPDAQRTIIVIHILHMKEAQKNN